MSANAEHTFPLYSLEDAERLRSRVLALFEEADRNPALVDRGALNFLIVGAGATGTETAGALAELIRDVMPAEYHDRALGRQEHPGRHRRQPPRRLPLPRQGDHGDDRQGAAVAEVGQHRHELHGAIAFSAWLGVHVVLLSGVRQRVDAFVSWAWDYFTRSRGPQVLDRSDAARIDWSDEDEKEGPPRAAPLASG